MSVHRKIQYNTIEHTVVNSHSNKSGFFRCTRFPRRYRRICPLERSQGDRGIQTTILKSPANLSGIFFSPEHIAKQRQHPKETFECDSLTSWLLRINFSLPARSSYPSSWKMHRNQNDSFHVDLTYWLTQVYAFQSNFAARSRILAPSTTPQIRFCSLSIPL